MTSQTRRLPVAQGIVVAAAALLTLALHAIAPSVSVVALAMIVVIAAAAAIGGLMAGVATMAIGALVLTQLRAISWLELIAWIVAATAAAVAVGLLRRRLQQEVDKTARLERSRETLQTSLREMSHRSKNGLAVLTAIATQSARSATTAAELAESLSKRFGALADAQDLITESHAPATDIARIVRRVLGPFVLERFVLRDPSTPALLAPDPTTTLALILHELATNAFKHGALRVAEGRAEIAWREEGGMAIVEWRERGGPALASVDPAAGFGLRLIRTALAPYGGDAKVEFVAEGFACTLRIPATKGESGADLAGAPSRR
jgi:two-component sensor histidine kinase